MTGIKKVLKFIRLVLKKQFSIIFCRLILDDDPLSNLINENYSRGRSSTERNASESRSRTYSASEAGSRTSTSFLDNFLNEEPPISAPSESKKSVKFDESSIAQTPSRKASNIDWLGIGKDDNEEKTGTNDVDWLTSGLSRRQQRRTSGGRNEEASAISQPVKSKPEKSAPSPVEKIADKNENDLVLISTGKEHLKRSEFDGELTVLRTKVSILEIEKLHLAESIDKLNANHEQEVNLLKQLHE